MNEERFVAAARNLAGEKGEQKDEWDFSGHVSRTNSLWHCYARHLAGRQKMGSQIVGEDQSWLPWRRAVRKVWRGGRWKRRASKRTRERIHKFRVRFRREKRASCLPCLSLGFAMTDGVNREAETYGWRSSTLLQAVVKVLQLSLTASSTTADLQTWDWRLTPPKEIQNLAAFSAREVK